MAQLDFELSPDSLKALELEFDTAAPLAPAFVPPPTVAPAFVAPAFVDPLAYAPPTQCQGTRKRKAESAAAPERLRDPLARRMPASPRPRPPPGSPSPSPGPVPGRSDLGHVVQAVEDFGCFDHPPFELLHPAAACAPVPVGDARAFAGPASTPSEPDAQDEKVDLYFALLSSANAERVRIDDERFVLEDHNGDHLLPGRYVHVVATQRLDGLACGCDCRRPAPCIHRRVVEQHFGDFLSLVQVAGGKGNPDAVLISEGEDASRAILSVRKAAADELDRKRTIVRWLARNPWSCDACKGGARPSASCVHRSRACSYLKDTFEHDVEDDDEEAREGERADLEEELARQAQEAFDEPVPTRHACSHRPIAAPRFARLASDIVDPSPVLPPAALAALPAVLPLGVNIRCSCGRSATVSAPTSMRPYRIYTSFGVQDLMIEVQPCVCRRFGDKRTIGPDLGDVGLLNWSNRIIFSHELLNAFSAQMHASPTPMAAFCTSLRRHSFELGVVTPFVSNKTFSNAFFAFLELQDVEVGFSCSRCGPSPRVVIIDGVSISFAAHRRLQSLLPPTVPTGPAVTKVRPRSGLAVLPNATLRTAVAGVAAALALPASGRFMAVHIAAASAAQALDSSTSVPGEQLSNCGFLAALVRDVPHEQASLPGLAKLYRNLRRAISTRDGVLSIIRPHTDLFNLALNLPAAVERIPLDAAAAFGSAGVHCPPLVTLLNEYRLRSRPLPGSLVSFSHRLVLCAAHVAAKPRSRHFAAPPDLSLPQHGDWQPSGVFYGARKVRERPSYPRFRETGASGALGGVWESVAAANEAQEAEDEGERTCRKYYSKYSGKRHTGGILALWYPHRMCLGFHVIPRGEGRNDAFSALLTRWETAPRYVIYDFACSLTPYSLSREYEFFSNTLFLIDQFHARDHTACSPSCFVDTYMPHDPMLDQVNSSAAECGNAGLGRIRKTVSYTGQLRAVTLMRHFLSLWNRTVSLNSQS